MVMNDNTTTLVRAKFKVTQVLNIPLEEAGIAVGGPAGLQDKSALRSQSVVLTPVTGETGPGTENHSFWKATPSGEIRMHIDNPECIGLFVEGKEYYVDFTLATPAPDASPRY